MSIVSNILYPASLLVTSQQGGRNGGPGMGGTGNSYEHGNMLPNLYGAEMMSAPFAAYHQQQQFPPNYMMPYPPQVRQAVGVFCNPGVCLG